jgi:hypothetical protein
LTSKRQSGKKVEQIIAELTPVLRGCGNYFRAGNADREFNKMDTFVVTACVAGSTGGATTADETGSIHRRSALRDGTAHNAHREIPGASPKKIIGKPCAGKRHARFERGKLETDWCKPVPR